MKPRFRLVPPTGIVPTKMKIKRASNRASMSTAPVIFDGDYTDLYTDDTISVVGNYWYQVSLSTDGVKYLDIPMFSIVYVSDYGPCSETVSATFTSVRRAIIRGSNRAGVLLPSVRTPGPTQAIVTNWPALVSSGCGVTGSPGPVATPFWEALVLDGEIYYFPVDQEGTFRIGAGAVTDVLTDQYISAMRTYLNDPTTVTNVYTLNGFKYKLVMLTETQVGTIGSSWAISPDASTPTLFQASSVSRASTYFAVDSVNQARNINNTGSTVSYGRPPASVATLYPLLALKYIGPA